MSADRFRDKRKHDHTGWPARVEKEVFDAQQGGGNASNLTCIPASLGREMALELDEMTLDRDYWKERAETDVYGNNPSSAIQDRNTIIDECQRQFDPDERLLRGKSAIDRLEAIKNAAPQAGACPGEGSTPSGAAPNPPSATQRAPIHEIQWVIRSCLDENLMQLHAHAHKVSVIKDWLRSVDSEGERNG